MSLKKLSSNLTGNLKLDCMPRHIAIILDGNGRWAQSRGMSRSEGHRAGGEALDNLLDFFIELKIPCVSMYAFSTENWKRPTTEIKAIWDLLNDFFNTRLQRCLELGIRVRTSGNISRLPAKSRRIIEKVEEQTAGGKNLTANFCVNYGSQDEIMDAAHRLIEERLAFSKEGKERKAHAPVKKKSSKSISPLIPCLP